MTALPEVTFHIYPTDCDMLGHLNHATMLNFLERARWALLEPQINIREWARQPVFSVVRHVDIGYLAQSLPGEDLVIRSGLLAVRRTSYIIKQEVRKVGSNTLVAEASIVFVAVNQKGEPVPFPIHGGKCCRSGRSRSDRPRRRRGHRIRRRGLGTARRLSARLPAESNDVGTAGRSARCRVSLHPDRHARTRRFRRGPPYSMDRYADDVAGVLDVLQIERAVVCGLSMGGYVAFALWRRHRERVRALVLADTRIGADTIENATRRRELIDVAEAQGSTAVANAQIAGLMGKTTRERRPDIYDAVHRMIAQAPTDGVVGALEAMIDRPDSTETCATIDVPTLVVVGDEDVITPPKEARLTCGAIAGSRLEVQCRPATCRTSSVRRRSTWSSASSWRAFSTIRFRPA